MKSLQLFVAATLAVCFVALPVFGQQSYMDEPGIPTFTTAFPVENGLINLANGNLHIEIPIATYPQRGKIKALHYRLVYDSRFWVIRIDPVSEAATWTPSGIPPLGIDIGGGFRLISDGEAGNTNFSQSTQVCGYVTDGSGLKHPQYRTTYTGYVYQEPNGSMHRTQQGFKLYRSSPDCTGGGQVPTGTTYATDNSGYKFVINNAEVAVFSPDGTQVATTLQDTNGNSYSYVNGQYVTFKNVVDTLGRTPVVTTFNSTSPTQAFIDYLCEAGCNPTNGDRARVVVNMASVNWTTHFNAVAAGIGGVGEYNGPGGTVQSIVFPDGSTYQFQQDSYGMITSMTLPTGGQVSYGYTNFTDLQGNVNRWVTSRIVDGNTWTFAPTNGPCSAQSCNQQVTVTTPQYSDGATTASDTHVYTFVIGTGWYNGGAWNIQIQYFRGPASGAAVLTKTTDYSGTGSDSCPIPNGGASPLPVRETLAWPSGTGTLSKKVEYCYDQFSNLTTRKTWDYQPNGSFAAAPDREVDTTYKTDSTYVAANIINLPLVSTSYGPGHVQAAQTTYGYDETSLQPSNVTEHHTVPAGPRGNLTSVTKWLNTSSTPVISNTTWYDSGEIYESIDPLGHKTTTSFDSTGAYSNKVCNALNQCSYAVNDFNTGLMTSFTDVNGSQAGDTAHTTNYTFDTQLRPLCTNLPDGGQTCLSYPDANHVSRKQIITSALSDLSTTIFDSLGRISQTQHTLPAGISTVDTHYDQVGSPSTVSNPYFTTSDPTYGITQSFHDALGRTVKTVKQDGSVSTSAYSVISATPTNGTCVTSTDEAGKQRGACRNGFGELVEVDEPSGAAIQVNNHATLQNDGNFVMYNAASSALWSTGTSGTNASSIYIQDDGNLVVYIFKWQAGTYAAPSAGPFPTASCSIGSYLMVNQRLNANQCIASPHGQYLLYMASDGNFYIYDLAHNTGTWGPGTYGHPGAYAMLQTDGNFVVYDANGVGIWSSGTYGTNAERLNMEDDGRIILFKSAWNSGTSDGQFYGTAVAHPGCDIGIGTGWTGVLGSGQCFVSPNGRFELLMQADGNLVIYDRSVIPNKALWSSGTAISPVDPAVAMRTLYSYDGLGNLLRVDQKGTAPSDSTQWRTRTFAYDSLSRLLTAINPESGTITYSYDADSNLLQKTSPAPNQTGSATQTVSYCYDALHRVTGKGYGPQSCPLTAPVVTYAYDSGTNAIGKLASLTDQAGTATYTYDLVGRLTAGMRPIAGVSKSTSYTYNLDGSMKTLTYPSGRVVTYTPTAGGMLTSAVDANGTQYVSNAAYYPNGAENTRSMPVIFFSTTLNPRLQVSAFYSNNGTDAGLFVNKAYDYGAGHNNGNVISITNYKDSNRTQTFTYDALNRIASGSSAANTGTYSWGENYSIDAWGNLQMSPMSGKAHGGNFTLSGNAQNRPTGLAYDAAGNLMSYLSATYTYDQENRLASTAGMSYTYDGNGERVLKSNSSTGAIIKRYWSMGGNTLAEGDGSGNLTAEYIYFGGKRVARVDLPANTVHYYLSDHLNSTSMVVSSSGIPEEESDYSPFGTEYVISGSGVNRYKFTGKERDSETGLDNFGARYDSSAMGRFMTADWSPVPVAVPFADPFDPQTLNLYSYVRNSALNRTDPTGHYEVNDSGCSGYNQAKCQRKYDQTADNFEKQRQKDLKSKDPRVRAAAAAFGNRGAKNGVHVGFADLSSRGIKGEVDGVTNNGKGKVIDVEVTIDKHLGGKDLQETIAHEGTHVADDVKFLTSYDFSTGRYDPAANFTHGQTEFDAFQAGAGVTREHGFGPNDTRAINNFLHSNPQYQNVLNQLLYPNNADFPQ